MQFLSDVYLRCPDCDGRRYRADVLDVKLLPLASVEKLKNAGELQAKSIADVLDMTVSEASIFFSDFPEIIRALEPLRAVGLDYLSLGQPVPTLSGGEAQRLKLAGHLARSRGNRKKSEHILFLFDEPTTGLHFEDISKLVQAFRELLSAGHTVVVIEHNLEVIRSADWIIDLGPEGGEDGGEVVCTGTPSEISKVRRSYTGKALGVFAEPEKKKLSQKVKEQNILIREREAQWSPGYKIGPDGSIVIRRAREHNLKNIDVRIPRDLFTVITGVSGSGKSTVAFDILFSEGQRRYLESLNAYARQFVQPVSRPDIDGVVGVPPTVAIEQRTSRGGRKSTVATLTEIYHFMRLLFVKLGIQYCPFCEVPIQPQSSEVILAKILKMYRDRRVMLFAPLVKSRKGYYTDLARWALNKGYPSLRVDGAMVSTENWPRLSRFQEHNIELPVVEELVSPEIENRLREALNLALEIGNGVVYVAESKKGPGSRTQRISQNIYSTKRACPSCGKSFSELDPRLFSYNSKHGWCPHCYGTGLEILGFDEQQTGEEIWWNEWWEGDERTCAWCNGLRLKPEALAVKFRNRNIAEITRFTIDKAEHFFSTLKYGRHEEEIARDIVAELLGRLVFLKHVGLSYLSLDRAAPTLSSGESQRIRLASQLGSNLRGVCYILDEPTIGLHARDNMMLLNTLQHLKDKGNTIVVVEHDETTIRQAEHIVDLGPGGGVNGGGVVFQGSVGELIKNRRSLTAQFLRTPLTHPLIEQRQWNEMGGIENGNLEVVNARMHNLKGLLVKIPLGKFICVTGVSGSGKSTLVRDVLYENMKTLLSGRRTRKFDSHRIQLRGCDEIKGWESVDRVMEVDQTPIGKTPRSCPATYVGFWDDVRRLFALTAEARMRGYTPSRFSFNVAGGRCDDCKGQGLKKIEMSFLPDVAVVCDVCRGKRFNQETLSVRYKDKNISDVLDMSVDEAVEFFTAHQKIHHALRLMQDVGLGYLTLGQQSPSLSGGEAQRIKLVTEFAKTRPVFSGPFSKEQQNTSKRGRQNPHSFYLLDEPTIGLHAADVEKLIRVMRRLVDAGNTVVVIEHHLDIIAEADWIIDLGPEGGNKGGKIVAQGTPKKVARVQKSSHTGLFLARFLEERKESLHIH
jgi:excinuclease ABC subunit A